jgi:hypothetical protein
MTASLQASSQKATYGLFRPVEPASGGCYRRPARDRAGEALKRADARRLSAAATYGVFSGHAFENLASSPFERIVVTDTIPLRAGAPSNIDVLSCAPLLADSIRRIFTNDSVSAVFGGKTIPSEEDRKMTVLETCRMLINNELVESVTPYGPATVCTQDIRRTHRAVAAIEAGSA